MVTAIRDVTPHDQVGDRCGDRQAAVKARTAAIAQIESASCTDKAKTRCQVVSLYGGGQYKLYTYRKYSDVRIVWAPESRAPQFGGDPDNFNFPRYSLDASFLRAYENGKPVATPQHLKWAARAPVDGEATFVVGNPGSTQRLLTGEQLAFQREVVAPLNVTLFSELRGRLIAAMEQSPARAREGKEELDGVENSLKVYIGRVQALGDPAFMGKIAAAEADLKAKSRRNKALGNPWGDVAYCHRRLPRHLSALPLHRPEQRPLRLRPHFGPRRGRTRQAQWRAPARLLRQRAASGRKAIARRAPDHAVARPLEARMEPVEGARISRPDDAQCA